jgi:hypothetical protein
MAEKQYEDALRALRVIERVSLPAGKYLTYGSLATELDQSPSKYARHIGQVCSLIDAACYWAKLPMLSLEKVRMDDGSYNPDSIGGEFRPVKARLIENAAQHIWSSQDISKLVQTLNSHMNGEGALLQWKKISSFGDAAVQRLASYR